MDRGCSSSSYSERPDSDNKPLCCVFYYVALIRDDVRMLCFWHTERERNVVAENW